MTLKQVLNHAREVLTAKDIADAALECEILLRQTLKISRVQLYQDLSRELNSNQETTFWQLIQRRLSHEPTAYITRHCEFYDLDFYVDPGVLIPRPESELLVEEVLKYADKCLAGKSTPLLIADVGTGSGAIAITLARQLPRAKIYATDVSMFALKVAAINCRRHRVENQVQILTGDMLEILPEPVDLIVANLPYIKDNEIEKLIPEIRLFEPRIALAGGKDGLDKIRQLCQQICNRLRLEGYLLLEFGSEQGRPITNLLYDQFPSAQIEVIPDLNGEQYEYGGLRQAGN
jgi:release factor glutamine methyltransferase